MRLPAKSCRWSHCRAVMGSSWSCRSGAVCTTAPSCRENSCSYPVAPAQNTDSVDYARCCLREANIAAWVWALRNIARFDVTDRLGQSRFPRRSPQRSMTRCPDRLSCADSPRLCPTAVSPSARRLPSRTGPGTRASRRCLPRDGCLSATVAIAASSPRPFRTWTPARPAPVEDASVN